MIQGISHITMVVRDLERTALLLKALFNAQEVYSSDKKNFSLSKEKFFLIGDLWLCTMEGNPVERSYNHIAFKIDEGAFDFYLEKIKELELETKPPRPRVEGEGRSIYFYDYDNHLFELHTGTLEKRLQRYTV